MRSRASIDFIIESRPVLKKATFSSVGVLAAIVGYITIYRAALRPIKLTDLNVYLAAGKEVLAGGQNLYTVTDAGGLHYIYPPLFAILMAPLAVLPAAVASAVWY